MDENYDRLWKFRTIFDELSDSYAKYCSPTEHAAVDEIVMLFKGRAFSNTIYQRNTKGLGSKLTNFVILRKIRTM
jgi:hypothetical protein